MANEANPGWEQVMLDLLNEAVDGRPDSWRSLAATLAGLDGSSQNAASWKKTLERIRKNNRVTERVAEQIALALGVNRAQLPARTDRVTAEEVYAEVVDLRARVAVLESALTEQDSLADVQRDAAELAEKAGPLLDAPPPRAVPRSRATKQ